GERGDFGTGVRDFPTNTWKTQATAPAESGAVAHCRQTYNYGTARLLLVT
ncbi:hypothetical protein MELA_02781, partial [Candidatus Methylomirabilis lanthanidiphila]